MQSYVIGGFVELKIALWKSAKLRIESGILHCQKNISRRIVFIKIVGQYFACRNLLQNVGVTVDLRRQIIGAPIC